MGIIWRFWWWAENYNCGKNLEPFKEYWFISSITTKYNQYEAFTPGETVLK